MQTLNKLFSLSRILTVLLLLTLFAGCSDDEGSTGEPGTLDRLFSYPVIQGCQTCHYGGNTGPNLSRAAFANSLIGKNSDSYKWDHFETISTACIGVYVTPRS